MDRLEHLLQACRVSRLPARIGLSRSSNFRCGLREQRCRSRVLPEISQRWRLSSAELRQAEAAMKHWQILIDANWGCRGPPCNPR